jgi:hypothetical protein
MVMVLKSNLVVPVELGATEALERVELVLERAVGAPERDVRALYREWLNFGIFRDVG